MLTHKLFPLAQHEGHALLQLLELPPDQHLRHYFQGEFCREYINCCSVHDAFEGVFDDAFHLVDFDFGAVHGLEKVGDVLCGGLFVFDELEDAEGEVDCVRDVGVGEKEY